jgi:hypothetical protein
MEPRNVTEALVVCLFLAVNIAASTSVHVYGTGNTRVAQAAAAFCRRSVEFGKKEGFLVAHLCPRKKAPARKQHGYVERCNA